VIRYQPPTEKKSNAGGIMAITMAMMLRQQVGVAPRWCTPAQCREIARLSPPRGPTAPSESPAEAPRWVVDLGSVRAVAIPPAPTWAQLSTRGGN
jgi:hypothetical protein